MKQSAGIKLIKEGKKHQGLFYFSLVCMFFSGLMNVLPSWLVKVSIDGIAALEKGQESFSVVPNKFKTYSWVPDISFATDNLLVSLPILIVVVFSVSAFFRFLYQFYIREVGLRIVKDLREKYHWHISKLSLETQSKYDSGSLVARITSDLNSLQSWVAESLSNLFNDGFKALFLFVWLLVLDWKLTLISMLVIPIFALPVFKLGKKIRDYSKRGQDFIGGITTFSTESLLNQRVTKAYNTEKIRQDDFIKESEDLYGAHRKWVFFMALVSPVTNIIGSMGIAGILFLGLKSVMDGNISVGDFSSFFVTSILLYDPVKRIGRVTTIIQSAIGVGERVYEVLEEDIQEDKGHKVLDSFVKGSIEFKDVKYSYQSADSTPAILFKDLNLSIEAKTTIALVGPSGSGKTTLVSLLPRFYEIDSGEILIDGHNINDLSLRDLRRQIALVTQDALLFTGTIRENIMLGNPKATQEEFEASLKKAHVPEFANELENGVDSSVGERGQSLSVGQRQRVALARAFISNAPIMIFDEPTSALDNESEAYIRDAIQHLKKEKTVLIIAHRLNTIKNADRIVYLQDGTIRETGTHDELVKLGGSYAKLLQEV